jgi:hypothetical protein
MSNTPDPIITDPQKYNPVQHATLKLIGLALIDAELARDKARMLALLPGPHPNDMVNVIDVLARTCAGLIRSKVGEDAAAQRLLIDTLRDVVLTNGGGL